MHKAIFRVECFIDQNFLVYRLNDNIKHQSLIDNSTLCRRGAQFSSLYLQVAEDNYVDTLALFANLWAQVLYLQTAGDKRGLFTHWAQLVAICRLLKTIGGLFFMHWAQTRFLSCVGDTERLGLHLFRAYMSNRAQAYWSTGSLGVEIFLPAFLPRCKIQKHNTKSC